MELNKKKVGVIVGAFVGGLHVLWSLLVLLGLAQPFQDFVFSMHFLNNPFTVGAFSLGTAVLLVLITSVVGYLVGWVLAAIWNRVHRPQ